MCKEAVQSRGKGTWYPHRPPLFSRRATAVSGTNYLFMIRVVHLQNTTAVLVKGFHSRTEAVRTRSIDSGRIKHEKFAHVSRGRIITLFLKSRKKIPMMGLSLSVFTTLVRTRYE